MTFFRRYLFGTGYGSSVVFLMTGSAVGQALGLAVAPFLTRLYEPSDLGILALYTSIVSVISVVACLRYEVAIPLPEDDDEASRLAWVALVCCAASSALVGIAVMLLAGPLGGTFETGPAVILFALMPVSVLGIGVVQTLTFWSLRRERFRPVGAASGIQGAAQAAVQISLGLGGAGATGLLIGHAAGRVGGATALWAAVRGQSFLTPPAGFGALLRSARRYGRFPLVTTWSSLINSASAELPIVLLSLAFGSGVVGLFALTTRVLQAPMALVGQAMGQVYYASSARHPDRDTLSSTTRTMLRRLSALAMGPLLLMMVSGPIAFELVFGPQWRPAGNYAQWLAPWLVIVFITSPISTLVFVLGRQRLELLFQGLLICARLSALGIGALASDANLAVQLFALVSAIMWAAYLGWLVSLVGIEPMEVAHLLGRSAAKAALLVLPALVAILLVPSTPLQLTAIGLSGMLMAADTLRDLRSGS